MINDYELDCVAHLYPFLTAHQAAILHVYSIGGHRAVRELFGIKHNTARATLKIIRDKFEVDSVNEIRSIHFNRLISLALRKR